MSSHATNHAEALPKTVPYKIEIWLQRGLIAILAVMPFHAFLTVFLGMFVGHRSLLQGWKEIVIALMALGSLWYVRRHPERIDRLRKPYNLAAIYFVLIALMVTAFTHPNLLAVLLGIKTDLEFLALFAIAQLIASRALVALAAKIILITSAVVAAFGVAQATFLPADFLAHFGYGPSTIEPFLRVTSGISSIRILSTLGGPNQLGAYLILPICLVVALMVRRPRWWQPFLLGALTISLIHTYSRSAWIGALAGALVTIPLLLPRKLAIATTAGAAVILVVAGLLAGQSIGQGSSLQYYLLHSSVQAHEVKGSDADRTQAIDTGIKQAEATPFGRGLGSAGPASYVSAHPIITEDYYVQLAIEVGIFGLLSWLIFNASVAWKLLSLAKSPLPAALLGSLIGISIVNLFLHGWADSTLALVWWGTAGLVVGDSA